MPKSVESQKLDVALSTRATESTLSSVLSQLDITISALRDALRGANTKDFSTLEADAESILSQLDITLSALRDALRGTGTKDFTTLESDIEDIRNALSSVGTDKLLTTPDNPSNLDVALSTRASESTLSSLNSKTGAQTSFSHGQETVGTSAVQLTSASATKGVLVKAHKGNSGTVYVGNSSSVSTTNGFELGAGEAVEIEVDNANKIWVIADAADQKVSWVAV